MFAWVSATTRLVQWGVLAGVVATTLATSTTLSLAGVAFPAILVPIVAAAVAAAAAASLDDPANALLAPVATSRRRRLVHRLAIVGPACLICWLALAPLVDHAQGWVSTLPQVGALMALGVATTCVAAIWRPETAAAAGAAVPLALASASTWMPFERLADAAAVWSADPWPVMAVATAVGAVATDGAYLQTWRRRGHRLHAPAI